MNERIDLSPLDPFADPGHRDQFVRSVLERGTFELARRRRGDPGLNGSVFVIMAAWAKPALAAAALAILVSSIALQVTRRQQGQAETGVVEALAVPEPATNWVLEGRTPTKSDLVLTLEGETSW